MDRITETTLLKVLNEDRTPCHGGSGQWPEPGVWTPRIAGRLKACERGYHVCTGAQLIPWLGPAIWIVAETRDLRDWDTKYGCRAAVLGERVETWNERTARLFAADCAERVLPLFEQRRPDDDRPRQAIAAARAFARGEIDEWQLVVARDAARGAARDAARDAAWAAAWAAARDAAWAAAWAAAGDAAGAAAWDAAGDAAGAAAESAERQWQTARLLTYLNGEVA
jgi:hypothetical protein